MPMRKMKVSDWIKVKDNPIQRDTERHAAKAKHLLTPLSIHAIVYAAELPNGQLVKLDGHTRALLWSRNQVKHPAEVEVNIIPVDSMDEAISLYKTLDSKNALETITDKVSGAFGEHNFHPESGLMKRGSIANALNMCWTIWTTSDSKSPKSGQPFDLYAAIHEFAPEIFALDSFGLNSQGTTSGIIAAFILTYRKHGAPVIPFWRSVFGHGGEKKNGKMDGVQALNELILQRKGSHGGSAIMDLSARAVMAAEKWLKDEEFQAIPRPYDLTGYIHGMKPAVQLIKQKPKQAAA